MAQEGEYPERWNYISGNILTEESANNLIELLRKSKEAGCTHVLWAGCRGPRIPELSAEQRGRARQMQQEARKLGIKIIPSVVSIGYSGRYFHFDPNLAAGVPVRNMPFVVKGKTAAPDPSLALDTSRLRNAGGRLTARYKVKPFMYYRVSFEMTSEPRNREELVRVTSSGGKRWNSRTNPTFKKENGKYLVQTVFNTLEGDEIRVVLSPGRGGARNVTIEPAGMLLILRRDLIPLTVTSEDGRTEYVEGRDFKEVKDPVLQVRPFPGDFPIDHPAPLVELTRRSRIREGERLSVSFWHHARIYNDQDLISMEDPKVWEILELEIKEVQRLWRPEGLMLNYDEIRVAGWEPKPDKKDQTPGELLAEHFKQAYDLFFNDTPTTEIYTWSDMFTPYHNARPFAAKGYYYLVDGNWDGSWEGLPEDVTIMNWYSPDQRTMKFFADRGHKQVLCGYYDGRSSQRMKDNIARWKKVSEEIPGVLGFMYTTWRRDYDNLQDYFSLLDSFEDWGRE